MAKAQAATSTSTPSVASKNAAATANAVDSLWRAYLDNTPSRLKLIDAFLVFIMLSGVTQFSYCVLVTNFPFNAFLSGYVTFPQFLYRP